MGSAAGVYVYGTAEFFTIYSNAFQTRSRAASCKDTHSVRAVSKLSNQDA